jgi:hypothetical protein
MRDLSHYVWRLNLSDGSYGDWW